MKRLTINLFIFIFFLSGCAQPSVLGRWKCDETGTIKGEYKDGTTETKPITSLYEVFNVTPFEFEFLDDGTMIQYNRKSDDGLAHKKYTYFLNYQGNANKIIIRDPEGNDDNIITIKHISDLSMKINLVMVDDESELDLVLNKVN